MRLFPLAALLLLALPMAVADVAPSSAAYAEGVFYQTCQPMDIEGGHYAILLSRLPGAALYAVQISVGLDGCGVHEDECVADGNAVDGLRIHGCLLTDIQGTLWPGGTCLSPGQPEVATTTSLLHLVVDGRGFDGYGSAVLVGEAAQEANVCDSRA